MKTNKVKNMVKDQMSLMSVAYLLDAIITILGFACFTVGYSGAYGLGREEWISLFAGFGVASVISMLKSFLYGRLIKTH